MGEAEARERMRQMLATPPTGRPADFENPLEKIEQLLTCPICLDRYKSPKLLPCQHTFCLPCLDSCADTLHRTLKCPECRAEHHVPHDGVKSFQTNYTLTGFLDIHLRATADTAQQIEEYIHRYNLERCKVCDEKAECETCAHCERRACADCRATHRDMLKRDLGRLLNQVKRLSNRIIEASDGLSKQLEMLSLNCEVTKTEVKEYFHRYQRELRKREEGFIHEIDSFYETEKRTMGNLRDVLEIESSNMSEGVARLDAAISGECEVDDAELVRFKAVFSEGLDYLRNFQPDSDELFTKKLRFSTGDDASKLPQAISTFGDLCVLVPQFSGRYLPLEQSYMPKPIRIGLESDHYRSSAREREERESRENAAASRPSSRFSNKDDESSLRFRRRQQLEEEAWNRLRVGDATPAERSVPGRSPFSRQDAVSPIPPEKKEKTETITLPVPQPVSPPKSPVSKPPLPKKEEPPLPPAVKKVVRQQSSQDDTSLNLKVENIRKAHEERRREDDEEERPARMRIRIRRAASMHRENSADPTMVRESAPPRTSPPRRQESTESTGEAIPIQVFQGEDEPSVPAWLARRRQRYARSQTQPDMQGALSSRVQQLLAEREEREGQPPLTRSDPDADRRRREPSQGAEWRARSRPKAIYGRKGGKPGELNWPRGLCTVPGGFAVADSSNHRVVVFDRAGQVVRCFGSYGCGAGQLDSAAGVACGRQRLVVTDRYNHRVVLYDMEGKVVGEFGGHGQANGKFNNPWGVAVDDLGSIYVADKDNHRVQVFDKNGTFIAKFGSHGCGPGQLNGPLFVAVSRATHQIYVSDSGNHRVAVFDAHGQHLCHFGGEGFQAGQFKAPRGVAIDVMGNVIVCDSGNNRIQVFTHDGEFVASFGTWGAGAGQLKGVEDVCVMDGQIVVSDRENHRIQLF